MNLLSVITVCFILVAKVQFTASRQLVDSCSFLPSFCFFTQGTGDEFDWTLASSTASTNTGPSSGASGIGDYFAYIEASSPRTNGELAKLYSQSFSPGEYELEFYNYARGADMGALEVSVVKTFSLTATRVWSRTIYGPSYDSSWAKVTVNVSSDEYFQVAFIASVGASYSSDFAIDEVQIYRHSSVVNNQTAQLPSTNTFDCDFGVYYSGFPFDASRCGLIDDMSGADQFDWSYSRWSTASGDTGPPADYSGYGYYLFIDASSKYPGDTARLISPAFTSNTGCMTFSLKYYSYGADLGSLKVVRIHQNLTEEILWVTTGVSDRVWKAVSVDFSVTSQFKLAIIGEVTGGYRGDYAIDNLKLGECGTLPTVQTVVSGPEIDITQGTYTCQFNSGTFCSLNNVVTSGQDDFDWTINQGSTSSSQTGPSCDNQCSGYYAYIEASSPRTKDDGAILETPTFTSSSGCIDVTFYWHGYGSNLGELRVMQTSYTNDWTYASVIWTASTYSADMWQFASVKVYHNNKVKIAFKGVVGNGFRGDYAIDDISISDCSATTAQPPLTSSVSQLGPNTYYTTEQGTIQSPGYPMAYSNNALHSWYITVGVNRYINLNLDFLSTESCCDEVKIYDVRYGQTKLQTWSGSMSSYYLTTLSTYSNQIRIDFQSDSSVTDSGFLISWYSTDAYGATNAPVTWPSMTYPTYPTNPYAGAEYVPIGAIVGGVVGGIFGLIFLIIGCCCCCKKKTSNTVGSQVTLPATQKQGENVNTVSQGGTNQNFSYMNQQYNSAPPKYYNPAFAPPRQWYESRQGPPNRPTGAITSVPPNRLAPLNYSYNPGPTRSNTVGIHNPTGPSSGYNQPPSAPPPSGPPSGYNQQPFAPPPHGSNLPQQTGVTPGVYNQPPSVPPPTGANGYNHQPFAPPSHDSNHPQQTAVSPGGYNQMPTAPPPHDSNPSQPSGPGPSGYGNPAIYPPKPQNNIPSVENPPAYTDVYADGAVPPPAVYDMPTRQTQDSST